MLELLELLELLDPFELELLLLFDEEELAELAGVALGELVRPFELLLDCPWLAAPRDKDSAGCALCELPLLELGCGCRGAAADAPTAPPLLDAPPVAPITGLVTGAYMELCGLSKSCCR